MSQIPRNNIHGLLLLDKPQGLTSNAALQKAKRIFHAKKAGHTGSLDPMATGMLPLCFGEATKFSQYILEADKTYFATVRLGITTTTADAMGEIISTQPVTVSELQLREVLSHFTGSLTQIPPMYSALKRQGKPLYELARQGITVERAERQIHITSLELLEFNGESFSITVEVSKGTYIRTLAEDIGGQLGCGAHLTALRRLKVGHFDQNMIDFETLSEVDAPEKWLMPLDLALKQYPEIILCSELTQKLRYGQAIKPEEDHDLGLIRLYQNKEFIGLGEIRSDNLLYVKRLLACNMID